MQKSSGWCTKYNIIKKTIFEYNVYLHRKSIVKKTHYLHYYCNLFMVFIWRNITFKTINRLMGFICCKSIEIRSEAAQFRSMSGCLLWIMTCHMYLHVFRKSANQKKPTIDGHHDIGYKNMLLLGAYYFPKNFWFGHVNTSHNGNIKWVISDLLSRSEESLRRSDFK